jgi:hypothetical protein
LILSALAAGVVLAHADADVVAVEAAPTLASADKTTFPACTAERGVTFGRAVGVV